jgi:hypothetical protein
MPVMRKAWFVHAPWLRTISPGQLLATALDTAGADPWQRVSPAPSVLFSAMLWDGREVVAPAAEPLPSAATAV